MSYLTLALLFISAPSFVSAMPIKTQMLKPRAYFVEAENNLLEPLDLKSKTLSFVKSDFDQCGTSLLRKARTLTYSCTLPIASKARISRLQRVLTAQKLSVEFGGSPREVQVQVSPDAKSVTFTTCFDHTGIDFEVSKFNDDFFQVYAKVAQLVISDAIGKQPLMMEVLENR